MNLQISRDQRVEGNGPVAVNLSDQIAYHMASILEILGLSHIRIRRDETMCGIYPVVAEKEFFVDVPPDIIRWVEPAVSSIGSFLSSFGIMSMTLSPGEGDNDILNRTWSAISPSERKVEVIDNGVRGWSLDMSQDSRPVGPAASIEKKSNEDLPEVEEPREQAASSKSETMPETESDKVFEPEILVL